MERQSEELLIVEDKLTQQIAKYFNRLEKKVQKVVNDNQDLPADTVAVLVNVILEDMNKGYKKLLHKHLRMTEKLARRHTKEIITLQQKKKLGQKRKATIDVSFKELPLTWLSMKAQSTLDNVLGLNIINNDAPYKIQQNKQVHDYLRDHTLTVSDKTRNRINKDIQKILTHSETEGIGNKQVADKIQEKFNQLQTWEARRIARTEINAANNLIAHNELLQNDLVDYKMWIATSDNRTRDTHRELNREITRIGHPFSNGLQYPGDHNGQLKEFINCRCRVIAWIPDYDKVPPTGKEYFREEDCLPLPQDEGQQVILQLPEDVKLYEVKQGYLEVQAEQLGLKPYGQQSLNSYVEEFKKLFIPSKDKTGKLQDTIIHSKYEGVQTTFDKILQQTREKVPPVIHEVKPLEQRTFKQLDQHLTTQIKKQIRIQKRYENREHRLQEQIKKLTDKKHQIQSNNKKQINKQIEEQYEQLMSKGLTDNDQKRYSELVSRLQKQGIKLDDIDDIDQLIDKSDFGLVDSMDFIDLMEQAPLSPNEQALYDSIIAKAQSNGVIIAKDTEITDDLIKQAHLKFKERANLKKLHGKLTTTELPEEYIELTNQINSIKNNPDFIEMGDPVLERQLKQLEAQRRVFIKENTPESIRYKITKEVESKTQQVVDELTTKIEQLNHKLYDDARKNEAIQKNKNKIKQLIEPYYNKAHKKFKRPSDFIKHETTKIKGKTFRKYDKTIQDEIEYTKYSIFEGADTTKFDEITEFYTDNSTFFNKYVNLKNGGATQKELDDIIEQEWYKEIFDENTGQFKTDIKNKYKNIKSKEELRQLFDDMHTKLIERAEPLNENIITVSVQNLDHYDHLQVGDLLPDTGFISTTLSEKETINFAQKQIHKGRDIALLEFHIEEGVEVDKILQAAIEKYNNEREITLIPGYEMKITQRAPSVLDPEGYAYDVEKFIVEVKKKIGA